MDNLLSIEQKIISTAGALFTKRLYVDVSIMDIITTAGIARGSFYKYFATKDECFVRCVMPMITSSVPNELMAFCYQNDNKLLPTIEKHIELLKKYSIMLKNTLAFMYATENALLRHMLANAYSSSMHTQVELYRNCVKQTVPDASEAVINKYASVIMIYLVGIMSGLHLVEAKDNMHNDAVISPAEFLAMVGLPVS